MVDYDKRDGIAYITLNRPEAKNAINPETHKQLWEIWRDFRDDDSLEVAIMTGTDDAFCAGADLSHEGLAAARKAVFGNVPWQRCQFHLQQNAGQYVPSVDLRVPVAADLRAIFNAPDQDEAEHLLSKFLDRYRDRAPKLVTWAEENVPQGFTVFALPSSHRRRLRTTNLVERLNEEIRRRTRVARLFPNEASCLRLVTAIVMEIAEEWQTAEKRYLTFID